MQVYEEKNFKIIIADENTKSRDTMASKLRFLGFHVELATGGFHLIHLFEKFLDFNLIILSEDMNDMSAEEIMMLVRTKKTKGELPILYISKISKEDEICEKVLSGANEYVVKSTNFQPIVDRAVKYFLQARKS
ncbi:MAG: response regulator [Bacteriovorax sp.]|nr:response regulator [Bacteriovorax sp.]